jgi:hypothetical protein
MTQQNDQGQNQGQGQGQNQKNQSQQGIKDPAPKNSPVREHEKEFHNDENSSGQKSDSSKEKMR